jgi:hypothetical protein
MWESIVLCLAGGAFATAGAVWGLDAINAWMQSHLRGNLAFWWVWGFDRTVLISAGAFVTLTIAVLGGVVSARVASIEFNAVLRDGGTGSGNRRGGRVARALVITQVTTVTVLMFFGVISSIVAYRVANVDIGYDTRNLLSASIALSGDGYETHEKRGAFFQSVTDGLNRRAGLDGALLRSSIAEIGDREGGFSVANLASVPSTASPRAYVEGVLGPLSVLGISLNSGRFFDARDDDRGAAVAVVSRSMAEKYWPGRPAVGQRIRLAADSAVVGARTVVGVVSDILMGNPLSRSRSTAGGRRTDGDRLATSRRHRGCSG